MVHLFLGYLMKTIDFQLIFLHIYLKYEIKKKMTDIFYMTCHAFLNIEFHYYFIPE